MLSIEDLFAFGVGCDIAGGYLVARGLLVPVPTLALRNATFWGFNATAIVTQAEDRARGEVGTLALVFGFVVQAVGFAAIAGGAETRTHGLAEVAGVVLAAAVPIVLVLSVERWRRPRVLRRLLLDVAHFDVNDGTVHDAPSWLSLYGLGTAAFGETRREGESNEDYARRVWAVERIREE